MARETEAESRMTINLSRLHVSYVALTSLDYTLMVYCVSGLLEELGFAEICCNNLITLITHL